MDTGDYKHLLLAVDFENESEPVIARTQQLRKFFGARLTLLHVVEHVPPAMEYLPLGYSDNVSMPVDLELEEELMALARRQLEALGQRLDVPVGDCLLRVGPTGPVIDETAAEVSADLVVVGSHGRHGLMGLFGSTARSVLRDLGCDVLCVKIERGGVD